MASLFSWAYLRPIKLAFAPSSLSGLAFLARCRKSKVEEASTSARATMARFERRLRQAWSLEADEVPAHLQSYAEAWERMWQQPLRQSTMASLQRGLRQAKTILVSDFHPLPRSRSGLALQLEALPPGQEVVLILELLPYGTCLSLQEAQGASDITLITGQGLAEAYAPLCTRLIKHKVTLLGAWQDGSVTQRDRLAVDLWKRLQKRAKPPTVVLHFGDWHLADAHLPQKLRLAGAQPLVLHQSPEPVWQQMGADRANTVWQTSQQHWVWLHTPPLALWANFLQSKEVEDDFIAEAAEHLCESASEILAECLGFPSPQNRLSVWPTQEGKQFVASLPRSWRQAFAAKLPQRPLFHPYQAAVWSPQPLDWTQILLGAAHGLALSATEGNETSFLTCLQRFRFQYLCAYLGNPFLQAPSLRRLAQGFWPNEWAVRVEAEVRNFGQSLESGFQLSPSGEILLLHYVAQQWAKKCTSQATHTDSLLQHCLELPKEGFDWAQVMATIRAA